MFGAYTEIFHGLTFDEKKKVEVGRGKRSRAQLAAPGKTDRQVLDDLRARPAGASSH